MKRIILFLKLVWRNPDSKDIPKQYRMRRISIKTAWDVARNFTLCLAILLLVGCASTREISTPMNLRVLSDVELSHSQLATLDDSFKIAQGYGLKADPSHITIIVRDGVLTPGGNFGLESGASSTGWCAGRTLSFEPIMIELPQQHLENLLHELNHCILFQKTGDADANHLDPSWKKLNLF